MQLVIVPAQVPHSELQLSQVLVLVLAIVVFTGQEVRHSVPNRNLPMPLTQDRHVNSAVQSRQGVRQPTHRTGDWV